MSVPPVNPEAGQGNESRIDEMLAKMPEDLVTGLDRFQVALLMGIANDRVTVTIDGFPVPHLHAALNALLFVMADYPPNRPQYDQMLDAANGITTLLDDLHPGAGAAYQVMAAYYREHAGEDVE